MGNTMPNKKNEVPVPVTADEALARLIEGNERFLRGAARFGVHHETLADLAGGQAPFATILGCSDSRVPPELIFDAGFGDLFVIRVAGNVVSPEVLGSLQYAETQLETPLFIVLGHERCGAVTAALDAVHRGATTQTRIEQLLDNMIPGLAHVDPSLPPAEELQRGVEANVRWSMQQILLAPEAQMQQAKGRMKLVGAIYEIETGRVRFLD
jgi:carbonic anhydrase